MELLKCNPQWVRKPQQVMANVLAGMQSKAWLVLTIKLIGE